MCVVHILNNVTRYPDHPRGADFTMDFTVVIKTAHTHTHTHTHTRVLVSHSNKIVQLIKKEETRAKEKKETKEAITLWKSVYIHKEKAKSKYYKNVSNELNKTRKLRAKTSK